ncbi:hypothetical protein DERP_009420 [Dermatophagoides pteronyssinus]|uniref:Uncharacterized protein n=1 Tax=Dermatophagoides pteronyssinus TaxID=6956 RepID=A0ABQ8IUA1_DERPT|nr:hypothetical protein DERP_009420 [Dermatophagoides pteronyssinus]
MNVISLHSSTSSSDEEHKIIQTSFTKNSDGQLQSTEFVELVKINQQFKLSLPKDMGMVVVRLREDTRLPSDADMPMRFICKLPFKGQISDDVQKAITDRLSSSATSSSSSSLTSTTALSKSTTIPNDDNDPN